MRPLRQATMNGFHEESNRPSSRTRVGTRSGESIGIPSTNVKSTPTPRVGRNRRRRIAFAPAGVVGDKTRTGQNVDADFVFVEIVGR
jgi:hypothetical protein